MRPIDADIIIKNLTGMKNYYDAIALDGMIKALKESPTIEAVPVVRGEWIHDVNNLYGCSECGSRETMSPKNLKNFCPNCGAKMTKQN